MRYYVIIVAGVCAMVSVQSDRAAAQSLGGSEIRINGLPNPGDVQFQSTGSFPNIYGVSPVQSTGWNAPLNAADYPETVSPAIGGAQRVAFEDEEYVPSGVSNNDTSRRKESLLLPGASPTVDPRVLQEYSDRTLDTAPDRNSRSLIERSRTNELNTEHGVDTTAEAWTMKWGGLMQGDWVNWMDNSQFTGQTNYIEFRRLRLYTEGMGYGVYEYKLELEFAPASQVNDAQPGGATDTTYGVELKDAYMGVKDMPFFGTVRFGNFKAPQGLETLTAAENLTFLERSVSSVFDPARQLGVGAFNHTLNQRWTWAYGAFFYDFDPLAKVVEDDNQGTRFVSRVTWTPFYDEPSEGRYLVHTGLGYSYNMPRREADSTVASDPSRSARFRSLPEIDRGTYVIDTGELQTDSYSVINSEAAWVHGPFSLQSELYYTDVSLASKTNAQLYGGYVYASYFLTGENRRYDRLFGKFSAVTPYENFWMVRTPDGARAGWGAWETAVRWSYLDVTQINGEQLNDLTVGLNWYWNPHVRWMFDWIHPVAIGSPAASTVEAQGDIFATRLQAEF